MRVYRFEEPVAESLGPRRPRRSSRRRRVVGGLLVALALILGALAGAAWWLGRDTGAQIPLGTRIDGVDVGGMTAADAKEKVRAHGRELIDRGGLVLVAGGNRFVLQPDAFQLRPNAQVAVKQAQSESTFLQRLEGRLGLGDLRDIPLTYLYNPRELAQAVLPVRQAVNVAPRNATIVKGEGARFVVAPALDGKRLDVGTLRRALRDYGATGPELDVPVVVTHPAISTDEAKAAAEQARTFATTPHIVTLDGDPRRVPRSTALRAVRFVTGDGAIRFDLAPGVLRAYFSRVFGRKEVAPRNARFVVNSTGKARIIGSRDGRGVDVESLIAAWLADPSAKIVPITVGVRRPALTSEKAQQLGVKEIVGEFFTPYNGGARVSNIRRAAEILDQYIIPARATFSLNKALGERTTARGFVEAPMIGEGGVLKDAVGGGVSQVATTTFNAAFFAGLKLIAHTPHSFWITRYPKGREATVSWGGPELIFQNNWDAPVVILTHTTEAGITVQMLSDPLGRKVVAYEGKPYSPSKAKIIRLCDPALPPREAKFDQMKGSDGFHIRYGRRVYRKGKLISKAMWHWRYAPEDGIVRIGPGKNGCPPNSKLVGGTTTSGE